MLLLLILAVMTAMALPIAMIAFVEPVVRSSRAAREHRAQPVYVAFALGPQRPRPPTA
jgi:hypothetical protein